MITLRIDDVGASTKHFNQHGKKIFYYKGIPFFFFPLANFWFFKRIWPFKKWAPYSELTAEEWVIFLDIFEKHDVKPIVSITACWVEKNGDLVDFPTKFPREASVLKKAVKDGKILIANHGLTHCVVGKHLPKFWGSNRRWHREFWSELSQKWHEEHTEKSQKILEGYFEQQIHIFVPPGNIWSHKTYKAVKKTNIRKIISYRYMMDSDEKMEGIEFVDDKKDFFVFHDRELKLYGEKWLIKNIKALPKF